MLRLKFVTGVPDVLSLALLTVSTGQWTLLRSRAMALDDAMAVWRALLAGNDLLNTDAAREGVEKVGADTFSPRALELTRDALAAAGVTVERSAPPWSGEDVVALIAFAPVTASDLERLPALRVIAAPSVGYDHVDVEAAARHGVWVCNVPDYCVDEMADHALALLLSLVRGVVELDRSVREGHWDHAAAGPLVRLSDVRLGIVGFGRIGQSMARRASGFGMRVQRVNRDAIAVGGVDDHPVRPARGRRDENAHAEPEHADRNRHEVEPVEQIGRAEGEALQPGVDVGADPEASTKEQGFAFSDVEFV